MKNFMEMVKETILDMREDITTVDITSIQKNNGVSKEAWILRAKEETIAPTIYAEYYFDKYMEGGLSIEDVAEAVLRFYDKNKIEDIPTDNFHEWISKFDSVKGCIYPRIINHKSNKELLKDVPHSKFLDLAVIYVINFPTGSENLASAVIHNAHREYWGVTTSQIRNEAYKNLDKKEEEFRFTSLNEFLAGMMIPFFDSMTEEEKKAKIEDLPDSPLRIITNKEKSYGANVLLSDNFLEKVRAEIGDYYILPSSVHEIMVMPVGDETVEELNGLIEEVNATQVDDTEVLSSHAYLYDGELKVA